MHLDEGELRGSVDGNQQIELVFFGAHFGDIDMEVTDRIGLELLALRPVAVDLRQSGDRMPLQATMVSPGRVACSA